MSMATTTIDINQLVEDTLIQIGFELVKL